MASYEKGEVLSGMLGKWPAALQQLAGWDSRSFNRGKHTACPICGGTDRFRWGHKERAKADEGFAWCNQCGSHDGVWWLQKSRGETFSGTINALGEWLGGMSVQQKATVVKEAKAIAKVTERFMFRMPHDVVSKAIRDRLGKGGEFTYAGVREVVDGELSHEFCNLAKISTQSGKVSFPAGKSWGAVVQLSAEDPGKIYLVDDALDAIDVRSRTGREVWLCFDTMNLLEVAARYTGDRGIVIVVADLDDYAFESNSESEWATIQGREWMPVWALY